MTSFSTLRRCCQNIYDHAQPERREGLIESAKEVIDQSVQRKQITNEQRALLLRILTQTKDAA